MFYMLLKPLHKKNPQAFPQQVYSKKALKWSYSVLMEFSEVVQIETDMAPTLSIIPIYPGEYVFFFVSTWPVFLGNTSSDFIPGHT